MNLKKMTLTINDVERMFICDPEKDSLADVLRRLGLTGVKVGCGTGVCGACSVILDDKVVRACVKKVKSVPMYSNVRTIEGIGSPQHLHPLQVAFMHCGAIQCGFCTPGFIVSAYALLAENLNPTRQEVRNWFQKHRNACRCTGYKQIVDAVMTASKVMRGECALEDIMFKEPVDGEYYGKPVVRPSALGKACGLTDYGEDVAMKMPTGTTHAVMFQPRIAHHAIIKNLDISEADNMPGVIKVVTYKDIQGTNRLALHAVRGRSSTVKPMRTILAEDKINRFGDVVAVVVADTEENARAAVGKIKLEIEQLPEYRSVPEACMPGAMNIHKGIPNLINVHPKLKGIGLENPAGVEELIDQSAFSAEGSFYTTPQPHMSIEGDTVQAYWDEDENMTIHCKSQNIYGNIEAIGVAIGMPDEKVRIVENPVGGSFGWTINPQSYGLTAVCAMAVNKPVALHMSYEEHNFFSGKRSASYSNAKLGCDHNGKITGAMVDIALDHGAYRDSEYIIERTARFAFYPYFVPNTAILARIYNTNNVLGTAYRGFGSPQVMTACESMMDILAEKSGIDPFEFRWRNIAREGQTNTSNYPYRCYPMEEIMTKMRPYYEKAVADAKTSDTPEIRRGVGLSWGGYATSVNQFDSATVTLELNPDGTITKYDTWQDVGQGGDIGSLMAALECLKPLGVTPKDIKLIQNDSKYCPNGGPSGSSRQTFINSSATKVTADRMLDAMRKPDGTYRSYDEMVKDGISTRFEVEYSNTEIPGLCPTDPNTGNGDHMPGYNYMLFLSEVAVDIKTGKTTVLHVVCVDDVGRISNIDSLNGQAYSGIMHGIGFALRENYKDEPNYSNIAKCGFSYINDVPDNIEIIHCENPRKDSRLGCVGAAEGFQSSSHMSVINAISNACGVRIYELPALPEKVKAGLDKLAAGEKIEPPKKFFLGSDLIEELENILANPI